MAAIQNDRDILLQAAPVRVLPVGQIQIGDVVGLPEALAAASQDVGITATATEFTGTTPSTITLTVQRKNGLTGGAVWTLMSGSADLAPSGDDCVITNASMLVGGAASIRARIVSGSTNHDAFITISKLGALAGQNNVAVESLTGTTISGKNVSGSDHVYVGGSTEDAPISLRYVSGNGLAGIKGSLTVYSANTLNSLLVNNTLGVQLGGTVRIGEGTLTINSMSLDGSLGSRVILKDVLYNVEVNGVPGTTVKFT